MSHTKNYIWGLAISAGMEFDQFMNLPISKRTEYEIKYWQNRNPKVAEEIALRQISVPCDDSEYIETITITVESGIIQDISGIPKGVQVKVMDFDVQEIDENTCYNKKHEPYIESVWSHG